jgi:hypothetical protein
MTSSVEKVDAPSLAEAEHKPSDEEFENYITIWSKVVDTQMHFNEMSVKSRQLGLTFIVSALGLAVVLLTKGDAYMVPIHGYRFHSAALLVGVSAAALHLVQTLDLHVYHRMLRGAVHFGDELEQLKLKPALGVEQGMTQAITLFSRFKDAQFDPNARPRYKKVGTEERAGDRINRFYLHAKLGLLIVAVVLLVGTVSRADDSATSTGGPGAPAASSAPGMRTGAGGR